MEPIIDERQITYPVVGLRRGQGRIGQTLERKISIGGYRLERVPCLCGNVDGVPVATRDCYGLSVSTKLCPLCGTMWTNPRLTEESFAEFYRNEYRPLYLHSGMRGRDIYRQQLEHGARIFRHVYSFLPQKGGVVFDVHCGTGGELAAFRAARHRTFGCENDLDLLRYGRADGLNIEQGGIGVLEKHGPAHLVVLRDTLDRRPSPLDELNRVSSLVQDGWFLYVEVPGVLRPCDSPEAFVRNLQIARRYYFTLKTMTRLLAHAGFKLIRGDENIRALYLKTQDVAPVDTVDQAAVVIKHLSTLKRLPMPG
jgi:SAM-dependent methyltransferase